MASFEIDEIRFPRLAAYIARIRELPVIASRLDLEQRYMESLTDGRDE